LKLAGLKIEENHVRVSAVGRRFGVTTPLRTDDVRLPDGEADRNKALTATLRKLKADLGVSGVVVGLELRNFSHHYVELPVTSKEDIAHALEFEMEKRLPLSPEEYVTDFVTVETTTSGSRNLVLSIRKSRIERIAKCAREAHVRLLALRCSAMEGINLLAAEGAASEVVFIFGTEKKNNVMGIRNLVPVTIKSVSGPEETAAEAERLSADFKNGTYSLDLKDRSMAGQSDIRALSTPVPNLLAMSAIRKRPLDLNFLPEELAGKKPDLKAYATVALCVASILLFFGTSVLSYYKDHSALQNINRRINEMKTKASKLMETRKEITTIYEKRQFLLNFQHRRNRQIEILKQLSATLPESAWLTNYSLDDKDRIRIQGYAIRTADIVGPLESSPIFRNVEFVSPVTVRDQKERFSIKMELEQ
jgi:Tfp pilus assembly protein PilN